MTLRNSKFRPLQLWVAASACLGALACSDANGDNPFPIVNASGGDSNATNTGGSTAAYATGGATSANGGATVTGGAGNYSSATGGQSSGGTSSTAAGGTPASSVGGNAPGSSTSVVATGGRSTVGGTTAKSVGGNSSGGSSTGGSSTGGATEKATGGSATGGTGVKATGGSASGIGGQTAGGSDTAGSGAVPTWTQLYTKYLAAGTIGHCAQCHSQVSSASAAYTFLRSAGQINGTSSSLTVQGSSRLVWFGGGMPQDGRASDASAQVLADFRAWVAAGAKNN